MKRTCPRCGAIGCTQHRATARNGSTREWRKVRAQILARDRYRCQQCGDPANTVDHIRAKANGGSDRPTNLRALCEACNLSKGDAND